MLYAAAGFGGGSSYLALLAFVGWKSPSFAIVALGAHVTWSLLVRELGYWVIMAT
jgi:hypothetical protein